MLQDLQYIQRHTTLLLLLVINPWSTSVQLADEELVVVHRPVWIWSRHSKLAGYGNWLAMALLGLSLKAQHKHNANIHGM